MSSIPASEHSIIAASQWDHELLTDQREIVLLVDDSLEGAAEIVTRLAAGYDVEIRRDVLVIDDNPSQMIAEMLCERVMKAEFIRGAAYAENGSYRQFEKKRRDGTFKRGRRR